MPNLPFKKWPKDDKSIAGNSRGLRKLYEQGFAGCEWRPRKIAAANELFDDDIRRYGGWPIGEDAARIFGVEDYGRNRISLNFLDVEKFYRDPFPGPPQIYGDCVSRSQANSDLITVCCECARGDQPDEVSGLIEGPPEISEIGQQQGCFASEYTYAFRGYSSHGWQCSLGASTSTKYGVLVRQEYPGWDLTRYTKKTVTKYGKRSPDEKYVEIGKQHLIRTSTRITGMEQVRDFCAGGFGISSCGGESFSSVRNEDGACRRTRKGWNHAMSVSSFDERPLTVQKYGEPLVLFQNSWGRNSVSGPRKIGGLEIEIPHGSFWARWSDVRKRSYYAMSSAMGWKPKKRHRVRSSWG